jgi:hypothetical protein
MIGWIILAFVVALLTIEILMGALAYRRLDRDHGGHS